MEVSLLRIKEYIEKITDEKLEEMKISRRDLEEILRGINNIIKSMQELGGNVGSVSKNQVRIFGLLDGLKRYLDSLNAKMRDEVGTIKKLIETNHKEVLNQISGILANLSEGLGKMDSSISILNSLLEYRNQDTKKLNFIDSKLVDISGLISKLREEETEKFKETINLLMTLIKGMKDVARYIIEGRRIVNDIVRNVSNLTKSGEQILGYSSRMVQSINKLNEDTKSVLALLKKVEEILNGQEEKINMIINKLSGVSEDFHGIHQTLENINKQLSKLDLVIQNSKRIEEKIDKIIDKIFAEPCTQEVEEGI